MIATALSTILRRDVSVAEVFDLEEAIASSTRPSPEECRTFQIPTSEDHSRLAPAKKQATYVLSRLDHLLVAS